MSYRRRPKQEHPYSPIKRLRYLLSRAGGTRLQKSQNLRFVTFNGQRFKRLILRDSFLAAEIERNLLRFGPSERIPPFVIRYEHEIWVEYIPGERLQQADDKAARDVAAFYASVNARRARHLPLEETHFHGRLQLDLRFLNKVGMLDDAALAELEEGAEALKPADVWVGFDYTDPVLKNFVRRQDSGAVAAVDVESLEDDQLIGTGAAKACLRWMEPHRDAFLEAYAAGGEAPDFRPYFGYVELCFLVAYKKLMFMERKWKHVDPGVFDRFRRLQNRAAQ
ncbi:MAG: hypothetical protein R3316_06310 [Rhodovibrionaceae bacterium]|nr:hypothetical protein [Rhodovibrionaceae bacterium]